MNKKLKNNSGAAMILALFLMVIISIFTILISNQLSNKLKSTLNTYDDLSLKYAAESGIERSIANIENQIISQIEKINNNETTRSVVEKVNKEKVEKYLNNSKSNLIKVKNHIDKNLKNDVDLVINSINSILKIEYTQESIKELIKVRDELIKIDNSLKQNDNKYSKYSKDIAQSIKDLNNAYNEWNTTNNNKGNIKVLNYKYYVDKEKKLSNPEIVKTDEVSIGFKIENNFISTIEMEDIIIKSDVYRSESKELKYEVEAIVKFELYKNEGNKYTINNTIKSYEKVKK